MSTFRYHVLIGFRLLLVGLTLSTPISCQVKVPGNTSKSESGVEDGFYQLGSNGGIKLGIPLKPIRPAQTQPALYNAPKVGYAGTLRRYVNAQANSRINSDISAGIWKTVWQTEIPSSFPLEGVLEFNGHIVAEASSLWFLYDQNGKRITQGSKSASGILIEGENFYSADSSGMIASRKLVDSTSNFAVSLFFGAAFSRSFILRNGSRMIIVSQERELDPDKADTKERSLVELVDLGERLLTDADGMLTSAKGVRHFARKTNNLLAASHGEELVLATRDRIYKTNLDLNFTHAFTGAFVPIALSLDEAGRIYITVEKNARRLLWILSRQGEIISEFEIPSDFGRASHPPVVGSDHRVFLSAGDEVIAIDPSGKLVWRNKLPAKAGGMVVTPNGTLLVSAGTQVLALDGAGNKKAVFDSGDQIFLTAPTITESGSILIASRGYLYKLAADSKQ